MGRFSISLRQAIMNEEWGIRNEEFIKCYLIEAIGTIGAIRLIEAIGTIEAIRLIEAIGTIETIYIFYKKANCALCIMHYALCKDNTFF